jgi:hypothetical protein
MIKVLDVLKAKQLELLVGPAAAKSSHAIGQHRLVTAQSDD